MEGRKAVDPLLMPHHRNLQQLLQQIWRCILLQVEAPKQPLSAKIWVFPTKIHDHATRHVRDASLTPHHSFAPKLLHDDILRAELRCRGLLKHLHDTRDASTVAPAPHPAGNVLWTCLGLVWNASTPASYILWTCQGMHHLGMHHLGMLHNYSGLAWAWSGPEVLQRARGLDGINLAFVKLAHVRHAIVAQVC